MHPLLKQKTGKVEQHFRSDDRCEGLFLWGSAGKGTDDAYSDLDLGIVVRDEAFGAVKGELRSVCEQLCGKIQGWLPEGEQDQFGNYAFLFEAEDCLLLCDFSLMSATFFTHSYPPRPHRILFDREGVLAAARGPAPLPVYSSDHLLPTIHEYWVYAYLNGKYWKRADLHKLLYVQSVLFRTHFRLLHALHPDEDWSWWPTSIGRLPEPHQERLRDYLGACDLAEIPTALEREMDQFSHDAQAAAHAWDIEYPHSLERAVRRHLKAMGLAAA
jgi:hypothetical protein